MLLDIFSVLSVDVCDRECQLILYSSKKAIIKKEIHVMLIKIKE